MTHSIQDEIKTLGTLLKNKRKELGLSIKDVESATSIRSVYIEAIEEGRGKEFIANVYAVGFLKQYTLFLGIDLDKMMRESPRVFLAREQTQEFDYGIGTLEYRNSTAGNSRWFPSLGTFIWAIVAISGAGIIWLIAKYFGLV